MQALLPQQRMQARAAAGLEAYDTCTVSGGSPRGTLGGSLRSKLTDAELKDAICALLRAAVRTLAGKAVHVLPAPHFPTENLACRVSGGSPRGTLGGSLRSKLADAELEDAIWALLPPAARAAWQASPKRMVTAEAQAWPLNTVSRLETGFVGRPASSSAGAGALTEQS